MNSSPEDERLAREFAKQREKDARGAPPFAAMWRVRPRLISPWWFTLPAVSAVAAAATIILVVQTQTKDSEPRAASASRAVVVEQPLDPEPLAFLLDSPTLESAPDFDESSVTPR